MENISEEINDLIVLQLSGDIDKENEKKLNNWISALPDNAKYYNQMRELWFSSAADNKVLSKYDKEKAYAQFKEYVTEHSQKHSHHIYKKLYYIAATISLLLICSYLSYRGGQNVLKSDFSNIIINAPKGSNTGITLPDGTHVWLNAGSRIEYSQGFGIKNRAVKLKGEGRFKVKENKNMPFSVQSENLIVRDIGTIFDFRDYPSDDEVIVSLELGKVSVSNLIQKEPAKILSPNQRVILNKENGKMRTENFEATNANKWVEGILSLEGMSMKQIANELERAYNVKIILKSDSIKKLNFYGDFYTKRQTLKEILTQLAATGKLRFHIKGSNVIIY